MQRRDFLRSTAAGVIAAGLPAAGAFAAQPKHEHDDAACSATYASPQSAMQSPPETLAFVPAIYVGTDVKKPDYLATVDVDPKSKSYCQVVHRLPMPHVGDELHHFGWNACSSCHGDPTKSRRYLVLPGLRSSRIHIVDVADPKSPKLHKVIEGKDIAEKTNLSAPHTVHCLPDGRIMLSMLGDAKGEAPGGFLLLDQDFNIVGRWEEKLDGMHFNYDFWYQPRHNVMISSEWAAPSTVNPGFKLEDVQAGKYGQRLHFWDWKKREIAQTIDLGAEGMIPLEVRFHHNPAIWHWNKTNAGWRADKTIQVEPVEVTGWPFPVPGLITDLVLSLDDRFLYFSNWLHGDIRQYDVSDPAKPKLTGRVWLGGVLSKSGTGEGKPTEQTKVRGHVLRGGPQMLQLSLDGKRLYVTNSLYSSWDNQFYPDIAKHGSYLLQLDCNTDQGGLTLNEDFYVNFGAEPAGPARAHEIRFPGGDCTSDIWV
jgi:selenium-binding protein 1